MGSERSWRDGAGRGRGCSAVKKRQRQGAGPRFGGWEWALGGCQPRPAVEPGVDPSVSASSEASGRLLAPAGSSVEPEAGCGGSWNAPFRAALGALGCGYGPCRVSGAGTELRGPSGLGNVGPAVRGSRAGRLVRGSLGPPRAPRAICIERFPSGFLRLSFPLLLSKY